MLLGASVTAATFGRDRGLVVAFDNGSVLRVFATDDGYESFTVTGPEVFIVK